MALSLSIQNAYENAILREPSALFLLSGTSTVLRNIVADSSF